MKWDWRWMIGDYVPVESGLRLRERRKIAKAAMRERVGLMLPVLYGACAGLMVGGLTIFGRRFASQPIIFFYMLLFALGLNCLTGFWIARRCWPVIHRHLHLRGIELCTRCNYTLNNLSGQVRKCPECGSIRTAVPITDSVG